MAAGYIRTEHAIDHILAGARGPCGFTTHCGLSGVTTFGGFLTPRPNPSRMVMRTTVSPVGRAKDRHPLRQHVNHLGVICYGDAAYTMPEDVIKSVPGMSKHAALVRTAADMMGLPVYRASPLLLGMLSSSGMAGVKKRLEDDFRLLCSTMLDNPWMHNHPLFIAP